MKKQILKLLKENNNDFLSGEYISRTLGVSRSAIWKHIKQLKEEGYKIEAVSNKGYKLKSSPDLLTLEEIEPYLNSSVIGRKFIYFNSIDSTNNAAKKIADDENSHGTVLISEEQTNGKGRLGRHWISPKYKGIWMSIILKPNLDPIDASKITQIAAAAVTLSLLEMNIKALIKWPNDIILNHKKVCGILTEMNAELTNIHHVIVGIGINVNADKEEFPDDLKDIATSLKIESNNKINRQILTAKILNNFEILYNKFINNNDIESSLKICREYSAILGSEIIIINKGEKVSAKAIDIDEEGKLIVKYSNGNIEKIISGEISIRGKESYI
ncbi:BirA family transcriptional regulator, biotin operon repressor / biotin-[acetyl-CoA-carboxylase] ligase [Clostridium sp. USBA 49]|uniref:biotin--[acetyl-CoA-carboxylase] ligase n=1 Tax=Clostridium sp. USBA 49 TaxID=1881060 RepID=UPI00099A2AF3|nr:biotin--[acetyl-CoA-carboxylase] ligase [Clostridium sp. USBA 49]SKA83087.1 BirA family transcriptional regulator, biotin operon repressor / biotin-[acetyl-CoA-carboxylase] ligase [Clostridium sp. USBA 49]